MTDLDTLTSLRERVIAAEGRDRELDADIATAMGHGVEWRTTRNTMESAPVITWQTPPPWIGVREPCPEFTASIDAALALIERMLPVAWVRMDRWAHRNPTASILVEPTPSTPVSGTAATLPLAILAALLSALIASAKEEGHAEAPSDR